MEGQETLIKLRIEPTLKQHECYEALSTEGIDEVFFGGGAGGGKSWAICESRLINAIRYPGYKSFIARNELKRLMQSTFITWNKVCTHHGITKDMWRLDGKYNVIELWNGSKIDLLDIKYLPVEDPLYERFGSLEYSDGAIEEAGETHPLAREVLKSRTNRHLNDVYGINPSLLLTGNPKKNYTYHLYYKPFKEGTLPENVRFIQSLYKDNPFTSASYGKTLGAIKDKVTRERLKEGNWEYEDDPAVLMTYEAITDLFTNTLPEEDENGVPYDEFEEKFATVDVARFGGDKIVCTCWRGWHAYKIFYKEKQSLESTKLWLKDILAKEQIPFSHVVADEDGVGGGLVDIMPGIKGFMANASPVEVEADRTVYTHKEDREDMERMPRLSYANLKTQCAYILSQKVNDRLCAVSTEDVKVRTWIVEDLEQVKEAHIDADDQKKRLVSKDEVKAVLGRSPDFGDTFIMRGYFDLKKPKKVVEAVQTRPQWISPAFRNQASEPMPTRGEAIQSRPSFIRRRR